MSSTEMTDNEQNNTPTGSSSEHDRGDRGDYTSRGFAQQTDRGLTAERPRSHRSGDASLRLTVERWRTSLLDGTTAVLTGGNVEGDHLEPEHVEHFDVGAWRLAPAEVVGLPVHDEAGEVVGAIVSLDGDSGTLTVRLAEGQHPAALAWAYRPRRHRTAEDGARYIEAARLAAVVALAEMSDARCWSWHGLLHELRRAGLAEPMRRALHHEHEERRAAALLPTLLAELAELLPAEATSAA